VIRLIRATAKKHEIVAYGNRSFPHVFLFLSSSFFSTFSTCLVYFSSSNSPDLLFYFSFVFFFLELLSSCDLFFSSLHPSSSFESTHLIILFSLFFFSLCFSSSCPDPFFFSSMDSFSSFRSFLFTFREKPAFALFLERDESTCFARIDSFALFLLTSTQFKSERFTILVSWN